jgi:hypothetical protein
VPPEWVGVDRDRDERLDRLPDGVIYFRVECTHDGGSPPLGRWAWVHPASNPGQDDDRWMVDFYWTYLVRTLFPYPRDLFELALFTYR